MKMEWDLFFNVAGVSKETAKRQIETLLDCEYTGFEIFAFMYIQQTKDITDRQFKDFCLANDPSYTEDSVRDFLFKLMDDGFVIYGDVAGDRINYLLVTEFMKHCNNTSKFW